MNREQQDDSRDNLINAATLWSKVTLYRKRCKKFYHLFRQVSLIYVTYSHITLINKIFKLIIFLWKIYKDINSCLIHQHWFKTKATGLRSLRPSSPRSDQCRPLDDPPFRSPHLRSQWRPQTNARGNPLHVPLRQSESAILEVVHKTLHAVKLWGEPPQLVF